MDIDFSALASRVAAFSDVLGCMILSPDGLVLGAFPPGDGDGDGIKQAWLRFAGVGDPHRSFVKFENEVWAYVRAGSYAAFAVATGATRPGVLLDHLEQALLVAGESREQRTVARAPGRVELVAGTRPKAVAPVAPVAPMGDGQSPVEPPRVGPPRVEPPRTEPPLMQRPPDIPAAVFVARDSRDDGPETRRDDGPGEPPDQPPMRPPIEDTEIDPIVLAREFAGLLQDDRPHDEENR